MLCVTDQYNANRFALFDPCLSEFRGFLEVIDDYDVSTPMEITISAFDLMSEIMHSYIFILVTDDCDYMTGVLVNSYHKLDEPFAVN
jgi:hypothetical protein